MRKVRKAASALPLILVFAFTAGVKDCKWVGDPMHDPFDADLAMMDVRPALLDGDARFVGRFPASPAFRAGILASGLSIESEAASYVVMLNDSRRIFVTDEGTLWTSIDLGSYFPDGGSISSVVASGTQILVGTDQGLAWVNALDGTYGHFSGAPASRVTSLVENGSGKVLAGIYNGYGSGPPSVFLCDPSSHTCALSNTGMTGDQSSYPTSEFATVGQLGGPSGAYWIFAGTLSGNGVFRSVDGGATWTPCRSGLPQSMQTVHLFSDGSNVFLSTGLAGGLYVSSNLGSSWTKVPGLPASGVVGGIGGDGAAVYAGVNGTPAVVYKSTDGGSTWQPTGSGLTATTVNGIGLGGLGVYVATNGGVFRSADGGARWARFNQGMDNATVKCLIVASNALYAGTDGDLSGVKTSTDGGVSWSPGTNAIANKKVVSVASLGTTVIATGPDGTFRSTDGGTTWLAGSTRVFSSLVASGGAFFGANPSYSGDPEVAVYKSTNGIAWNPANVGTPSTGNATVLAVSGSTLYAGIGPSLYRSTDGGGSWSAGGTVYAADTTYQISCLKVITGVLYAGLLGSGAAPQTYGFYKSLDGGNTWIPIRSGLPPNSYGYSIAGIGSSLFAGTQLGLFQSVDGGSSWDPFTKSLNGVPVNALAVTGGTLWVGTTGHDIRRYTVPISTSRLVPIVLDVDNGSAHYTTELSLTNRGSTTAAVTLQYTASIGSGSGTANESLAAGKQLVIGDVIAYLRGKNLPIPASGSQGGTLLVTFDDLSAPDVAAVTARTTTATGSPQPVGRAGLAYSALGPADAAPGSLTIFGLRSNGTDRSNLAVFSMSSEPVTLKVTAFSGDGDARDFVVASGDVLPAWGWKQYDGVLVTAGMANGWVTVERVSQAGAFGAYGVINDNGTNDGSFVLPSLRNTALEYLNVPVLVETSSFVSELTLANSGATSATLTLRYKESRSPAAGPGGTMSLTLPAGTQRIIPSVIAFLRQNGVAVGPPGGGYAGSLHVGVSGAHVRDVFAGARTASPSPSQTGGQFGLFTPALFPGSEALDVAYLYGLRADATNRSNIAVANTAESAYGDTITLQLEAFDGDAGGFVKGSPLPITLAPGEWYQADGFLGAQGVANGWVKVRRLSGTSPWLAYGVVNDGGGPGQRTGDGAYVPMVR